MADQKLVYDIVKGKNTLSPELKKSENQSNSLFKSIGKIGGTFGTIALKAAGVATALVGAAGAFVTVKAVREALELENALIGLQTVARGTGQSVDEITKAAQDLSKDGLIPLADASAALKNLLASGLDGDQAIKTFKVLRDSAAFGRQGSLDLGEAIRGATEGIKNGNSILVDNAGITKNLSVLQREYAESIGTTVGKLNEAQKLQAIYTGLQREGALFTGDYAKLQETFSGSLSSVSGNFKFLLADIGKLITQSPQAIALVGIIGETFAGLRDVLANNKESISAFVNALIGGFAEAVPVVIGFLQGFAKAVSFSWGVTLRLDRAINDLLLSFYELNFVQDIFQAIGQSIAVVAATFLDLLATISGTSVGGSFIENILGLDPASIEAKLQEVTGKVAEFGENLTGGEIAEIVAERGTVLDKLIGANEEGLERLNEGFEAAKAITAEKAAEITAATAKEEGKQTAIVKKENDNQKKSEGEAFSVRKALFGEFVSFEESTNKQRGENFRSTLGTISTLSQSSNSALFAIGKAAAISNATIDGIAAVQKALASAPAPFNFALAAAVGAASAVNIAKITSSKPPSFQDGGILQGSTSSGDQQTASFNGGELFLNRAQQAELFNVARGRDTVTNQGQSQVIDITLEVEGKQLARIIRDLQTDGFRVA